MKIRGRSPGRNFSAPGGEGKIVAVWTDLDGTVIECQPNFDSAEKRFEMYMSLLGFNGKELRHKAVALKLHHKDKFERHVLSSSFMKVYREACTAKKMHPRKHVLETCRDIGDAPFFREPAIYPDAALVLSRAWHSFFMIAVTIGDRDAQFYKIKRAGLRTIYDHVVVTGQDNKPEMVANTIEDLRIDPNYSLFIGNSARSDGQCLQNTNFLHMLMPHEGWAYDHQTELPQNTGYKYMTAKNWREAEELGVLRMQLWRQRAFEGEEP